VNSTLLRSPVHWVLEQQDNHISFCCRDVPAPSDISGIGGMHRECIRAVKSWRNRPGRYDTIFVNTASSVRYAKPRCCPCASFSFSFSHNGVEYPCALVHWFSCVGDSPDDHTGMWVVPRSHFHRRQQPSQEIRATKGTRCRPFYPTGGTSSRASERL